MGRLLHSVGRKFRKHAGRHADGTAAGTASGRTGIDAGVLSTVLVAALVLAVSLPLLAGIRTGETLVAEVDAVRHAWFREVVAPSLAEDERPAYIPAQPLHDARRRLNTVSARIAAIDGFAPEVSGEWAALRELIEAPADRATILATEDQFHRTRAAVEALDSRTDYAYRSLLVFLVVLMLGLALMHRLQTVRLRTMVAEQEESRRLTSLTLAVQEQERRRIGRDLHDEAAHTVALARMIADRLESGDHVDRLRAVLGSAMDEIRAVLDHLRPPPEWARAPGRMLAELCDRTEARYPITIHREISNALSVCWSDDTLLHVSRIAQEALMNVIRHARTGEARVRLAADDAGRIRLEIEDNGPGLDGSAEDFGLRGMRERAKLIGGDLHWFTPAGGGTGVRLMLSRHGSDEETPQ